MFDKNKWIYEPHENADYRYILGTVGTHPLFIVGINPSTATPDNLDNTMKSAERIAYGNGFDSYIMINVYAQRATNPKDINKKMNRNMHRENLMAIEKAFNSVDGSPEIWAAWGTNICKRIYFKKCLKDLTELADRRNATWYRAGRLSKNGHPHHPLYLKSDTKLEKFDITKYNHNI